MKKFRLLSLVLTALFLLSGAKVSFAATAFIYSPYPVGNYSSDYIRILAPVDGYALRHAYTAYDSEDSSKEYTYSFTSSQAAGAEGVYLDPDTGILSFGSNLTADTIDLGSTYVKATNKNNSSDYKIGGQKYSTLYKSYDYDFDDGEFTGIGNVYLITEESGNSYVAKLDGTSQDYASVTSGVLRARQITRHPVIVDFDFLLKGGQFSVGTSASFYSSADDSSAPLISHGFFSISSNVVQEIKTKDSIFHGYGTNNNQILDGWHNLKFIINWGTYKDENGTSHRPYFHVILDNQLVTENANFPCDKGPGSSVYFRIYHLAGMDNFKYYSTSFGIPYNIEAAYSGQMNLGTVLTANAPVIDMPGNIPETTEYAFFASDTIDGEYTKLSSGKNLTVTADIVDKYVKPAARTKETISDYASPWIYGEPIAIHVPVTWTETKDTYVYVPHGTDIYETSVSYTGGSRPGFERIEQGNDQFDIVPIYNNKTGLISVSPDVGSIISDDINNPYALTIKSADKSSTHTINFTKFAPIDFSDSDKSAFRAQDGEIEIKSDSDAGNYLATSDDTAYIRYDFLMPDDARRISDTYAIDFDLKGRVGNLVELTFWSDNDATAVTGYPIKFASEEKAGFYKDPDSSSPHINAGEGWKRVRIFVDSSEKEYSVFINNKAVAINVPIKGIQNGEAANAAYLLVRGEIDNFTLSNVTEKTPTVYNATIRNAAVGKDCVANYDFFCGATNDKSTTFEWFMSDTKDGTYTCVGKSYTPSEADYGKYIKAEIFPATEHFGSLVTGATVWTEPKVIGAVAVGQPSLRVDGEDVDIKQKRIAIEEKIITGEAVDVEISVPASLNYGEDGAVLFAIAQYNADTLENIDFIKKSLTASTETITLNLTVTDFNELTYFKLLAFKEDSLEPVNDVIYIQ